jgi:hypothetical protein
MYGIESFSYGDQGGKKSNKDVFGNRKCDFAAVTHLLMSAKRTLTAQEHVPRKPLHC